MDDWEWINNYFINSGANPEIDENCRIVLDPFDKTKHKLNYDWGLSANSMDDIAEEILSRRDSISSGSINYETSFDDFLFGNHDISEDIIDDYIDSLYDLTLDDDANVAPGLEEILQNNQSPTIPDDNTPSNPSDTDSISKRTEGLTPEPRISTPSPTPPPLPPRPSIPTEIPDNLPITKPLPPTPPWSPAPTPVPSPIPTLDIEVDVDSRPQNLENQIKVQLHQTNLFIRMLKKDLKKHQIKKVIETIYLNWKWLLIILTINENQLMEVIQVQKVQENIQ